MDVWSHAWPAADVEAIAALYEAEALFYSQPFRAPQAPRDYVSWVFEDQGHAVCGFGDPIVDGDRTAAVWWAVLTATDGSIESIAGTSLLRFDQDGRIVEQRDVWASELGPREFPDWAS